MERYNSRTIDELGRLVLHTDLRQRLGLETGGKISLKHVDTIVIMQPVEDDAESDAAVCKVDELGRIVLPIELRQKLGWREKDKLALYHTDNIIILKQAEISPAL